MGQNKYLNYILLAAIAFLIILQIWNPFHKSTKESKFDQTFDRAQETLDRFEKLNQDLEAKAALLKVQRSNIDSLFTAGMSQYGAAISRIDDKITAANREYSRLVKDLNAEKDRLAKLNVPQVLPTIEELRDSKYSNAVPK
jgi:septal ring factor EnvC (AmiA/AmiB activator)